MEKNIQMIEVRRGLEIQSVCALSYFNIPLICPHLDADNISPRELECAGRKSVLLSVP